MWPGRALVYLDLSPGIRWTAEGRFESGGAVRHRHLTNKGET